ncbi:MAG TPA: hypothetical protein DCR93_30570 [Cytophagales bacterium]|nr:hypothetical protein [Cytophagales bacterium]
MPESKGIFLTVSDTKKLLGTSTYHKAYKYHQSIRDALGGGKRKLTTENTVNSRGYPMKKFTN